MTLGAYLAVVPVFLATLLQPAVGFSRSFPLDESWLNHQQCIDMYGTDGFDPETEASITVTINGREASGVVSVVVFELGDEHLGGIVRPGTHEKEVICGTDAADEGLCKESQLGEFLISDEAIHAAHYPMMTRAIDVAKPFPIIYPVRKPGFYCTATLAYSVDVFTGTMQASEPASKTPAFKRGLLQLYRYMTPSIVVLSSLWAFWQVHNSNITDFALCSWIVPICALKALIRWTELEQGANDTTKIVTGMCVLLQMATVALNATLTSQLGAAHGNGWPSWLIKTTALVLASSSAVRVSVEAVATCMSLGPVYMNLLMSSFLGTYFFGFGITQLRARRESEYSMRGKMALGIGTLCLGLGIAAIGAANLWILAKRLNPADFGKRFWSRRVWLIDGPFDVVIPIWTASNVLMSSLRVSPVERGGVEEMQKLNEAHSPDDVEV